MIWRVEQVAPLHVAAVAAPLAGVAREKVEPAMWRVAKGLVEIAFADRDNFGTAVALALMLLLRLAPLWHRFAPHCVFEFHLLLPCEAHHRQRSVELRADERLYCRWEAAGSPLTSSTRSPGVLTCYWPIEATLSEHRFDRAVKRRRKNCFTTRQDDTGKYGPIRNPLVKHFVRKIRAIGQNRPNVRYWHKADIPKPPINVRFRG
jgi:hypothetical protein